jgi:flagella basal body P-ring formation protein FlgA
VCVGFSVSAGELGGILVPLESKRTVPNLKLGGGRVAAPDRSGGQIEEKDLVAVLERELTTQLGLVGDLRVSLTRSWAPLRLGQDDRWDVRIVQLPAGGLTSTFLLRFQIESEGRVLGDWQMMLRAQLWKPVWVAERRLDRGQSLDGGACIQQAVDVLREKQSFVPAETDLAMYELVQTVGQERPLSWRDISLRPLVRKGQIVDVTFQDGGMNIAMKAMAMSSGGAGDSVVVRNMDSRKDFTARVLRPNTVQVSF